MMQMESTLDEEGGGVREKTVKSGFWAGGTRIANRVMNTVKMVVLARVLGPSDFGVLGIALLSDAVLTTFSITGFQEALIQKKKDIKEYLSTAWCILALRGILLFGILFLLAPHIANFFSTPRATTVIRAIAFIPFIRGLQNTGIIYFKKDLEFHKQFKYETGSMIIDFLVSISAAIAFKNVWALVAGLFAREITRLIMSYILHPFRPAVKLDVSRAREMYNFGKNVTAEKIMKFFILQGDNGLVGKVLGATSLGLYQMAYRIGNMPFTEVSNSLITVTFSAFSKLQDSTEKLRRAWMLSTKFNLVLMLPASVMLFFLIPDFTELFMGEKWAPMVPAVRILVLLGGLRAIDGGTIFYSIGKPEISTRITAIRLTVLALIIYPLTISFGIVGTGASVFLATLSIYPLIVYKTAEIIQMKFRDFLGLLATPIASAAVMSVAMEVVNQSLVDATLFRLFASGLIGVAAYTGTLLLMDRILGYNLGEFKKILTKTFS